MTLTTETRRHGEGAAPHVPWSAAQRAKLCLLLKQRGLWADRHSVCGVGSLSDLTREQANAVIERLLNERRPLPPRRAYRGQRRSGATINPATDLQRTTIEQLLGECVSAGEPRHVLDGRLWSQHRYRAGIPMSTFTASQIIQALLGWKSNLLRRTQHGDTETQRTKFDGPTLNPGPSVSPCLRVEVPIPF